jgi:ubiquitin-conjugating enzyme E2 Z
LAQRRIIKERQKLEEQRQELESCGIYVLWGDELQNATALIIGPEDTPYAGGFYLFEIQFSDNYPMQPPNVMFRTGDGRVRFNPNLYEQGKVCLSILGTWSGPSWTSSCTLRTVLVSIQSLLNAHPIQNEPGYEKEAGKRDELYSELIRYENVAVAVLRTLREPPQHLQAFRPHMSRIFLERYEQYREALGSFEAKEGGSASSPIWNFKTTFKVADVQKELAELREQLSKEAGDTCAAQAAHGVSTATLGSKRPAEAAEVEPADKKGKST